MNIQSKSYLVLSVAILAVSMAAIFVRLTNAPALIVAAYRLSFASIFLLPISIRALARAKPNKQNIAWSIVAGAFLALHFATWISSLYFTSVAASVSIVATTPLWVTLFNWWIYGKSPSFMVLLAVLIAISGGALIGFGDFSTGSRPLLGDSLSLLGAIAAAAYLLIGRHVQKHDVSLNAYVAMAYGAAALFLLPLPYFFSLSYYPYDLKTIFFLILLALIPQMVGHTGINFAIKNLDPTIVSTMILLEPVLSSIFAMIIFKEIPGLTTLLGALLLLVGVAITIIANKGYDSA